MADSCSSAAACTTCRIVRGSTGLLSVPQKLLEEKGVPKNALARQGIIPFRLLAEDAQAAASIFNDLKLSPESSYTGDSIKSRESLYPPITPEECITLMLDMMKSSSPEESERQQGKEAERLLRDKIAEYKEVGDEHSVRFLEECLIFTRGYAGRAGLEYFGSRAFVGGAEGELMATLSKNQQKETDELGAAVNAVKRELERITDFADFTKLKTWLTTLVPTAVLTGILGIANKFALSAISSARPAYVLLVVGAGMLGGAGVYTGFRYYISKLKGQLEGKIDALKREISEKWEGRNGTLKANFREISAERLEGADERIDGLRTACASLLWSACIRYFPEYAKSRLAVEGSELAEADLSKGEAARKALLVLSRLSLELVRQTGGIASAGKPDDSENH